MARDLASCVIAERGFNNITDATYQQALERLGDCHTVLNCLLKYGEMNIRNRELMEWARSIGCRVVKDAQEV